MEQNIFDKVLFEVGEVVINKNISVDDKPHTISKVEIVTNNDGFSYSVLFFEDDSSFHVAYEYEPYKPQDKAEYYKIWNRYLEFPKPKRTVQRRKKPNSKILKFKINK